MQKILLVSLFLAGLNAQAQETTGDALNFPDLVVTATRSEVDKNQLATATTVYTRKDIERLQVQALPDLLKNAVGLDVTQNGGLGKTSSVFMRGTNSDHVLVLVDGIKFGSATLGTSPFEFIPIDQIERVEIIRGPKSSLYGSEAIGGVIQIFTRKGNTTKKPTVSLDVGGGSFHTHRVSGNVSGKVQNSWYSLGSSNLDSEGFSTRQPTTFYQPDHDGYRNTAVNARVGHHFGNSAEVEAFFIRTEGHNEFDSKYGADNMSFVNQVAGASGSMDIVKDWRSTLRLGQSRDDNDNFNPNKSIDSFFNSTRWNASWLNEFIWTKEHKLIVGADYRQDQIASSTEYIEKSRFDAGVFSELHSRFFDDHFVNVSVRGDKNEAFGDYVTGNFGWRYNWNYGISPFASFGNAFKAPTMNDLYYKDQWGSHGDPTLSPEESKSFEIGLAGNQDWARWEVRAYHTNIDNLITWYTDKNTYISIPVQTQKAQIDGVETEVNKEVAGWNNKLSFQALNSIDRETNLRLPTRADKILTYDLSHSFGNLDIGGNVLARSNSFDEDWKGNRTEVSGFVTLDLRSAYHFNKNWMLSAKLNNLLDKNYQTVNTYNTADRNFFVSVQYNN
jgi:vitamin B12 transporter